MSAFSVALIKILSVFFSVVLLPLQGLTAGIDAVSAGERTDTSRTNVTGIGAYFRSQGVACDGEYLYFSSKTSLICTEKDGKSLVSFNLDAIPAELKDDYGIKHIGGISCYGGKIYAGMEDSKVWDYPVIGVFDTETLTLEKYYVMDGEKITRGLPWVCVNPETGLLYCTDHSKEPSVLYSFDVNNGMESAGEIRLKGALPSVQGAEFCGGVLYAATNDETQAIYTVDINTGETVKLIDRNLTKGSEGEGMTFIEKDGKPVLLAIDMGPLFVNAYIREYEGVAYE